MDFRTTLTLPKSSWSFGLTDPVLTLGSCFSASMGDRLTTRKFDCCANPFGTTYHPLAIHRLLRMAASGEAPSRDGYVKRQDLWYHYDFHSSFSAPSRDELSLLLGEQVNTVRHFLSRARVMLLTYGTAWSYALKQNQRPVANCHKVPSGEFVKWLSAPEEIAADFRHTYKSLTVLNPDLRFVLTVSPVRHVKDTLPLNQVSKSALRLACHLLQEAESRVDYFPAYELMVDDLRDYRFYADDLIHPTPFAEEYIWQKFSETYFNEIAQRFLRQWEPLRQALSHRPLQPQSDAYREFLSSTLKQLQQLRSIADVEKEIASVEEQLLLAQPR
ncbi:MAG: GSCFA domain-containing protein [Cyclobacteriaceae bacterium]|nr:GSCFA domain-containing protein [Cyclobacteriaceae bacterium]